VGGGIALAVGCATGNGPTIEPGDTSGEGGTSGADCVPSGPEICDGKDNDCNGKTDEGFDADGDGYFVCKRGDQAADCNDKNKDVHPGATEVCNGVDDNCDGAADEGMDKDGDGFYECAEPAADGGSIPKDCDDADKTSYPGATEVCDGKDNDCNGKVDDLPATVTLNDSFSVPVNPHWITFGAADINQTLLGWARLTDDLSNQAGGVFWNTTKSNYTFDHFEMEATVLIKPIKNSGADGMAFVWVPESATDGGAPGVGSIANGFGLLGLGGYGVALDTFQNDLTEPAPPFTAVVDGKTNVHLIRNTKPLSPSYLVNDGKPHTLSVRLEDFIAADGGKLPVPGVVTVMIDGAVFIDHFVIPGYVPFAGKWGFTAGTGGLSEQHFVQNVTMKFPSGQGCVQ
jgi:hypothetical protein